LSGKIIYSKDNLYGEVTGNVSGGIYGKGNPHLMESLENKPVPIALKQEITEGEAVILSAVLSCFFVVLVLLIKETWDDSIYLPSAILKRYGLKCVGGLDADGVGGQVYTTAELSQNMEYFFRDKNRVALCPVSADMNPEQILGALKPLCPDVVNEQWFVTPAPLLCPESCEELRRADGILLLVNAGAHVGKNFERVLEFVEQQDCKITGVLLCGVDARLLKWYYFGAGKTNGEM